MAGFPSSSENVVGYNFADEEAGFLAGVAAATESRTGIVGFVGGTAVNDVDHRRAGFEAGALYVDPTITILARHVSADGNMAQAFGDRELGREAAADLYERDTDVVFHAAGDSGLGVFQAARERTEETGIQHWGIGVDSDQILDVEERDKPYVLMSVVRSFDVLIYDIIDTFISNGPEAGMNILTLRDEAITFSIRGDHMAASTVNSLTAVEALIAAGEIDVPTIPLGDLLPPLGANVAHVLTITNDNTGCRLTGAAPTVVGSAEAVQVEMINNASAPVTVVIFSLDFDLVASLTEVPSESSRTGFFTPTTGDYIVICPADFSDRPPLATITAGPG